MKKYYIEILREIRRREQAEELPPLMKELAQAVLGKDTASSVNNALNALQRSGLIRREWNCARSIQTTDKGREFLASQNNER